MSFGCLKCFQRTILLQIITYLIYICIWPSLALNNLKCWYAVKANQSANQRTRTLLSILADFTNAVVLMFSILLPISNSSSLFSNSLRTVSIAPSTVRVTVTFLSHFKKSFLVRRKWSTIFLISFIFILCSVGTAHSSRWHVLFFVLLINTRSGLLIGLRESVCISKSQRILCLIL